MSHYENLLTYLGINTFTQDNDEFLCNCIFCGDVKKNLQVNFIKKVFHCWACDEGGSLFKLVQSITGFDRENSIRLFKLNEVNADRNFKLVLDIMKKKNHTYDYRKFIVDGRFKNGRLEI